MNTRLLEINAKIERAKKHLSDLIAAIKEFHESKPYEFEVCDEKETGDRVWILRVCREPPMQLSAIVGDILNNLRSSLDYLVCGLAEGRKGAKQYFPISDTASKYNKIITNMERHILCRQSTQLLREVQAYKGGDGHGLWQLHQLNIHEKHRFLIPVGTVNSKASTSMPAAMMNMMREFRTPLFHPGIVHVRPGERVFPLKVGTELYRLLAEGKPWVVGTDPKFTFDLAFGEIFTGDPLFPVLKNLAILVTTTINKFVHLLK